MTGLININKPTGMTSRRVVDIVGRVAKTKRAGHAGTLDPLATGVVVVCLGRATRLVPFVQELPKRYRAEFLLGRRSDTDDITGQVIEIETADPPSREKILDQLTSFIGKIPQVPPAFSAVHVAGERAYAKARRGDDVSLAPREVDVYRLDLIAYDYPRLEFLIECGSGTYVRSIGRDLGEALGCGAVMSGLVRDAIGSFALEDAVAADELTPETLSSHLLPPLAAVAHLPRYTCSTDDLHNLTQGRAIVPTTADRLLPGTVVAIVAPDGSLAAIGEPDADGARWKPRQVFAS